MKVLVAVQGYPNNLGDTGLMYVHVRNLYYMKNGIKLDVLNFRAQHNYIKDGVNVITLDYFKKNKRGEDYDVLICHAPNIRSHFTFLKRYGDQFSKFIFFFHGHEILKNIVDYPKPYSYEKKNVLNTIFLSMYDIFKLYVWKKYFPKVAKKSYFVFVSRWIYDKFFEHTKIRSQLVKEKSFIINNRIGEIFEKENYSINSKKKFDFITIRPNMDNSKYGIDIVNDLARENNSFKFLIIGKGKFYSKNKKPDNVSWIDSTLEQEQIPAFLNTAKCALMPTREDTQGVMACEMASYGIPLISSDISVCREILSDYPNVELISNKLKRWDLTRILREITGKIQTKKLYSADDTVKFEVELIYSAVQGE